MVVVRSEISTGRVIDCSQGSEPPTTMSRGGCATAYGARQELLLYADYANRKAHLHPTVSEYLYQRRIARGWSAERAATQPSQKRTHDIRVGGVPTTVAEARHRSGVSYSTYYSRLRIGWSKARAASTPPTWPLYSYRQKSMSLAAWSRELKINYRTLRARLNRGLSFEEAVTHPLRGRFPKR